MPYSINDGGKNTVTPTVINSDLIEISQVKKSTNSNMNNTQYENFILYNLIKNNSPDDISINNYSIPYGLDRNNTRLTIEKNDPYDLKSHCIINNDDNYIQSEKFALNAQYIDKPISNSSTGDFVIVGPNTSRIEDSDIKLTNKTRSYYDSNLKFNISFNNDTQTTVDGWKVDFRREANYMNYFAAINSHLNTQTGEHPFRIYEDISINQLSLGVDGHYFTKDDTTYNRRGMHNFVGNNLENNTLAKNNLELVTNNISNFDFDSSHFGTYKIEQIDSSNITTNITYHSALATNSNIEEFPIGDENGDDVTTTSINFQDVSGIVNILNPENSSKIKSGFTATLDVSGVGGYICDTNDKFSIDDGFLTVSGSYENLNYFTNGKSKNRHYVDITNGSVTLDSTNANVAAGYITLSDGSENLINPYHTTDGKIEIKSTIPSQRTENVSGNLATSEINIYYNTSEGPTDISDNLRVASDVSYNVKVLLQSTSNNQSVTYGTNDLRNLGSNSSNNNLVNSTLVIANNSQPVNFNIRSETDFKFLDEDPSQTIRQPNKINILNIQNENRLVEEGVLSYKLVNGEVDTTATIINTSCDVTLENTPLDNMNYSDYRIKLETKNADDILNSTAPTNGWTFALSPYKNDSLILPADVSGIIIGNSNHQSEVITDVFTFLNGQDNKTIQYNLTVDASAGALNNIRYKFVVSSNGTTYSFGYNDTQFEYVSVDDTKIADVTSVIGLNKDNFIFEKWLRKKIYKATLDPSLPFYENLILKTPDIYEENEYYRAWKKNGNNKGAEISPIALQSFAINSETMNIVVVRLVENFDSTSQPSNLSSTITLHPDDCKIFKTKLQGKNSENNTWSDLGNAIAHIDPYIKQDGTISSTSPGFNCNLRVAFSLNVLVRYPNYYINITNPLTDSSNFKMTARLYSLSRTDIYNNPSLIENLSLYNSTFPDSIFKGFSTDYICDLSLNNDRYKLTISHNRGGQSYKDVEINFPKDYVLNFNIINTENLFSITRTIASNSTLLDCQFKNFTDNTPLNNTPLKVDDGVYLTLTNNNVSVGDNKYFSLKRDAVKVSFVDDATYLLDTNATNWRDNFNPITLDNSNQQIVSNAGTKSVIFHKTRGYNVTNNNITITRTATVYKFVLDASNGNGTETQIYEQTWNGGATNTNTNSGFRIDDLVSTSTILESQNNVISNDRKVHLDIGLILNINQSILPVAGGTVTRYNITPTAASYYYEFKNPNGATPQIVNGTGSGTLFDGVLDKFFNFKVRSLKAKEPIQIKVTYTSSEIKLYFNSSYTKKPDSNEINWGSQIRTFTAGTKSVGDALNLHPTNNDLATSLYPIYLRKTAEKIGGFTSYFVCAPPSYVIEFNPINPNVNSLSIYSLPFNQSNIIRTSVHVDAKTKNNNSYDLFTIAGSTKIGDHATVTSPSIDLQTLKTRANLNQENIQNVRIRGNYLNLSIYSGLKRPQVERTTYTGDMSGTSFTYTYDVFTDSSNSLIGTGQEYYGTIDDILTSPPRNANKLRSSIIINTTKYDISYSQPLDGIGNATNDTFNINFEIDNAFIPANVSYLPLPTNKSTAVTLYDTRLNYGFNGNYYLILNKYYLSENAGVDYNTLLTPNSNIRQISFRLNKKAQKSIELYMLDSSNGRQLINPINLSDASNVTNLLDNLNVNDLSGEWHETSLEGGVRSAGVSLGALDVTGIEGIRDLLQNKPFTEYSDKTLFIRRDDVLRVLSAVGHPVLRITNSGNIVTPKVTTSMISLLQQSVTTAGRNISYYESAVSSGLFSEGALDFSGNWL